MPKIALYSDRRDWALGTISSHIARLLSAAGGWETFETSYAELCGDPVRQVMALSRCDLIHWLSPHGARSFGSLFPRPVQLCTIHHCLPDDGIEPAPFFKQRILTVSNASLAALQARGFSDVSLVRYGVDVDVFLPADKMAARLALGMLDVPQCVVAFFGKRSSDGAGRKNLAVFIKTLQLVRQQGVSVGALLAGEGWDDFIAAFRETGIPVFAYRPSTATGVAQLYAAADMYLCVSRVEGGPLTVLEAMASGRPVVSTPVGIVPELIVSGRSGLLVPIDDERATADAVLEIARDPLQAVRFSTQARKDVVERWQWSQTLSPLPDHYRAALAHGTRRIHLSEGIAAALRLLRGRIRVGRGAKRDHAAAASAVKSATPSQ